VNDPFAASLPAFAQDINNLLVEACAQVKAVLDREVDGILADLYGWLQVSGMRVVLQSDHQQNLLIVFTLIGAE
jgi:hypothetical protein